eukprot:CFRG1924T1
MFVKPIISTVAIASIVAATNLQVQLFTDDTCGRMLKSESNILTNTESCIFIQDQVIVDAFPNGMTGQYSFMRQSNIDMEILLFTDGQSCISHKINSNEPVTFIRAMAPDECVPCFRCGNVQSVIFKKTAGKANDDGNAAGAVMPSALLTLGTIALTGYAFLR